jgi:hypothetical protein
MVLQICNGATASRQDAPSLPGAGGDTGGTGVPFGMTSGTGGTGTPPTAAAAAAEAAAALPCQCKDQVESVKTSQTCQHPTGVSTVCLVLKGAGSCVM